LSCQRHSLRLFFVKKEVSPLLLAIKKESNLSIAVDEIKKKGISTSSFFYIL
jgi:hypothetical protein